MTSTTAGYERRLSFDDFVGLHPGEAHTIGADMVRVPCPSCHAPSYVVSYLGEAEGFAAHCSADLGGQRRSAHLSLGCTPGQVARALGVTESAYSQALQGVAPYGSHLDSIDWTGLGHLEDLDRARLLLRHVRLTGRDVVFTEETNGWLIWTGQVWEPAKDLGYLVHEIADALADASGDLFALARAERDEDRSKALADRAAVTLKSSRSARDGRVIDRTLRVLRQVPGVVVPLTDFDAHADLLQAANGVIDLRTGTLREPRKEDRITRRLSVEYRPEATAPTWDHFLSDVLVKEDGSPDPEVADYMRRLIGYGITGSTREQCFGVLHGRGGNGKGVFIQTLTSIFAPVTETTPFSTFEERAKGSIPNDIAALRDARLVMASEGELGRPMAEAVIKSVTGSDPISARFMRAEFFTFKPQFLILLATNYRPSFRGQDEGLWRRVKMISFRRYFAVGERDESLPEKIMSEAEGVLAWAVRGAVEWYANGLQEPASITDTTARFRRDSDRLGDFIQSRLTLTDRPLDVVTLSEVFQSYREWAQDEGDRAMGRVAFAEALGERRGIHADVRSGVKIYRSVKIKTDAERKAAEHDAKRPEHLAAVVND